MHAVPSGPKGKQSRRDRKRGDKLLGGGVGGGGGSGREPGLGALLLRHGALLLRHGAGFGLVDDGAADPATETPVPAAMDDSPMLGRPKSSRARRL